MVLQLVLIPQKRKRNVLLLPNLTIFSSEGFIMKTFKNKILIWFIEMHSYNIESKLAV